MLSHFSDCLLDGELSGKSPVKNLNRNKMINKKVIDTLYKRYDKRPSSPDDLDIALLFEGVHPMHNIVIDGDEIVINSIPADSPFHRIPLRGVHAIVEFEESVAIVLHSSIIFLSKMESEHPVSVHIKPLKESLGSRLLNKLGKSFGEPE